MICLQWEPEIIAIAMLYLSFKINRISRINKWDGRKANEHNWWDRFVENLRQMQIEDICHNMLDYYSKDQDSSRSMSTAPPVPPINNNVQNPPENVP